MKTITLIFLCAVVFSAPLCASEQQIPEKRADGKDMKTDLFIQVVTKEQAVTLFKLNNSTAAKELYAQLPLSIKVEDYASKEKIFYPPQKLGTSNTPQADAKAGTLAYFAPWGDVVMFYKPFGSYRGLYELGEAVAGGELISRMSGTVQIEKYDSVD